MQCARYSSTSPLARIEKVHRLYIRRRKRGFSFVSSATSDFDPLPTASHIYSERRHEESCRSPTLLSSALDRRPFRISDQLQTPLPPHARSLRLAGCSLFLLSLP